MKPNPILGTALLVALFLGLNQFLGLPVALGLLVGGLIVLELLESQARAPALPEGGSALKRSRPREGSRKALHFRSAHEPADQHFHSS